MNNVMIDSGEYKGKLGIITKIWWGDSTVNIKLDSGVMLYDFEGEFHFIDPDIYQPNVKEAQEKDSDFRKKLWLFRGKILEKWKEIADKVNINEINPYNLGQIDAYSKVMGEITDMFFDDLFKIKKGE